MRTAPVGSVVGSVAGLVFVLVNAGAVPRALVVRIAGVLAFAVVLWFVVRGPQLASASSSREALRTYWVCVVAMLVALPVGGAVITNVLGAPDVVPVWVVFVVGAHFLPFARAFDLPVFRWLSLSMVAVSVVGASTALALGGETAAGWAAVAAGFILLIFSAVGPRWDQQPGR